MKTLMHIPLVGAALICLPFMPVAALAAEPAAEAITPSTRIELFNGKDFTGWTFFMRSNASPSATWSITNGVIQCAGRPPGYIRTERNYRDYKVTVEWRFTKSGNTGVLLHAADPDKIWPKCVEAQGQSGKQGEFWLQSGATCKGHEGADSNSRHILSREPSNEKPVGEWNTFEAVCAGNNVKIYVNGKLMNEAEECSVSSGHIGLQSEGGEIEVRKVFLEPLK